MAFTNFWKALGQRSVYMSPFPKDLALGVFKDVESNENIILTIFQGGYDVPGKSTNFENKRRIYRTETDL